MAYDGTYTACDIKKFVVGWNKIGMEITCCIAETSRKDLHQKSEARNAQIAVPAKRGSR